MPESRFGISGPTQRRDELRHHEEAMRKLWELEKPFDVAPDARDKFFITFPYPYMNGDLHLGHAFSFTKADFYASYQRLLGKNVLLPFGFHVTGMPLKGAAVRLGHEIEEYGCPPVFPEDDEQTPTTTPTASKTDPTKFTSKRTKLEQKSGGQKFQWQILESLGIPPQDIPEFVDAAHYATFFPPRGIAALERFGAPIDWRRTFVTSDINPYYDSFIRWQFHHLKELNKVRYGKRYTIFCPADMQPCTDHDRAVGDGVRHTEYSLIKLELVDRPQCIADLDGPVYCMAATLRPETMYGQTNCWVLPKGQYGVFRMNNGEYWICTERAAFNASMQFLSAEFGVPDQVAELEGKELIGKRLRAMLSPLEFIYMLPMHTISMSKGTGVVTSVPADAPDDWISLLDLRNNESERQKFGITDEMLPEPIPIIQIPDMGPMAAEDMCNQLKITNQHQRDLLAQAKDVCYTRGFHEGIMSVGPYAGQRVVDVKDIVREELVNSGKAVMYAEPDGEVVSRTRNRCGVALWDQWFLTYGEPDWKDQVRTAVDEMRLYHSDVERLAREKIDWLGEHALSRSFGLGTRIPWDEQYLIESLSDSTIYMAYYTIAHHLQGNIDGSLPGDLGLAPEDFSVEAWDYVFIDGPYPEDCAIPQDKLDVLKQEFSYWYPMDFRTSGKELMQNHLLMMLYNHAAIFPKKHWPQGMRVNGHLLLDGMKMSKSSGNYLSVNEACKIYTSDAVRLSLAQSGDTILDANFLSSNAEDHILKIWNLYHWMEGMIAARGSMRQEIASADVDEATKFADLSFLAQIKQSISLANEHYDSLLFSLVVRDCFIGINSAREQYLLALDGDVTRLSWPIIEFFMDTIARTMMPIIPHFAERVWRIFLRREGSVRVQAFLPESSYPLPEQEWFLDTKKALYFDSVCYRIRSGAVKAREAQARRSKQPLSEIGEVSAVHIYTTDSLPEMQRISLDIAREGYSSGLRDRDLLSHVGKTLKKNKDLKKFAKKAMPFIAGILNSEEGIVGFQSASLFDEHEFLSAVTPLLIDRTNIPSISVFANHDDDVPNPQSFEKAAPLSPATSFIIE